MNEKFLSVVIVSVFGLMLFWHSCGFEEIQVTKFDYQRLNTKWIRKKPEHKVNILETECEIKVEGGT